MLSVQEAIAQRHSVRSYTGAPVQDDQVQAILEAGRNAPSSLNSQPWRFKVVRDAEMMQWFAGREVSKGQKWLAQAGAIIICLADLQGYLKDSQASAFYYREHKLLEDEPLNGIDAYVNHQKDLDTGARFGAAALNVGIAVSFMMLQAVELGLGSCWVGMYDEQVIKKRLNIDDGLRIVCLLALGTEAEPGTIVRARKKMEEVVLS